MKIHNPLVQLVLMHLREFYRLPESLFWTFIFPIALAGLIGLGFSSDSITPQQIAIIEVDNTAFNYQKHLQLIAQDSTLKIITVNSYQEGLQQIRKGKISLIIEPKPNTTFNSQKDSLIFHFDHTNETARNAYNFIQSKLLAFEVAHKPFKTAPILTQGNRYIDFLIPGLLAMGIMNSALWGMGFSLVDFRVKKLMRRMIATPMPRWIFLFSHFITRYLFAFLETACLAVFAWLAFSVEITGSFLALLLLFSTGLWAFAGISILISARAMNATIANGLINAVSLPMTLASGVFFSYQGFPDWLIVIIQKLPLTMLADGFREVFNEGATLADVSYKLLVLTLIGTISFIIGLKIYKWY
jgi:ABC-2 type transport system permease protein